MEEVVGSFSVYIRARSLTSDLCKMWWWVVLLWKWDTGTDLSTGKDFLNIVGEQTFKTNDALYPDALPLLKAATLMTHLLSWIEWGFKLSKNTLCPRLLCTMVPEFCRTSKIFLCAPQFYLCSYLFSTLYSFKPVTVLNPAVPCHPEVPCWDCFLSVFLLRCF